jgi:hypothetical protein
MLIQKPACFSKRVLSLDFQPLASLFKVMGFVVLELRGL